MLKRVTRRVLHTAVYHLLIRPSRNRVVRTRVAGFDLAVPPTVFHPRWFLSSETLARFVLKLDLDGLRVADVGTGSGVLALAAARAGAGFVAALDVNPAAASAAAGNARSAGLADRVAPVCSDLFGAIEAGAQFDVVLSNPPFFAGEPRDVADRAWHAGPDYRDIRPLFDQIRERLSATGRAYVILSTDADLARLAALMTSAGLAHRIVRERRLLFEALVIYELTPSDERLTRA